MRLIDCVGNEAIAAQIQAEGLMVELVRAQHCLSKCVHRPAPIVLSYCNRDASHLKHHIWISTSYVHRFRAVVLCFVYSRASSLELPLMLGRVQFERPISRLKQVGTRGFRAADTL